MDGQTINSMIEGINEIDLSGDTNFAASMKIFTTSEYSNEASNPLWVDIGDTLHFRISEEYPKFKIIVTNCYMSPAGDSDNITDNFLAINVQRTILSRSVATMIRNLNSK